MSLPPPPLRTVLTRRFPERRAFSLPLGRSLFDVSLLNIEDGILEIKPIAGDTHLGPLWWRRLRQPFLPGSSTCRVSEGPLLGAESELVIVEAVEEQGKE